MYYLPQYEVLLSSQVFLTKARMESEMIHKNFFLVFNLIGPNYLVEQQA